MGNYKQIVRDYFEDIVAKYDLDLIRINEHRFVLVGWHFAIGLFISMDGVTLDYLLPNADGSLDEYWFDTYISKKFDEKDQIGVGNPRTIHETIIAELKISANGLMSKCEDILRGDQSWIEDFIQDGSGGIYKANKEVAEILGPIFNKQN